MNLGGVVSRLATGTYTVTRGTPGSFGAPEDGRYAPGPVSTLSVRAIVLPVTGRDLERFPEGERTKERIEVFSTVQLFTAQAPDGVPADIIAWQGRNYEVEEIGAWNEAGGYWHCFARKVGQ